MSSRRSGTGRILLHSLAPFVCSGCPVLSATPRWGLWLIVGSCSVNAVPADVEELMSDGRHRLPHSLTLASPALVREAPSSGPGSTILGPRDIP